MDEAPNDREDNVPELAAEHKGAGLGMMLGLSVLAALAGAAGGYGLTHTLSSKALPVDLAPISARIAKAEDTLSGQRADISRLKSELAARPAKISLGSQPSTADLSALSERLTVLEGVAQPRAHAGTDASDDVDHTAALKALEDRVSVLEDGLSETQAMAAKPIVVTETVLLPSFPRAQILTALTESPLPSDAGFIEKTLKKHISVRNPEDVDAAEKTLDDIEALIEAGDIAAAREAVEALPPAALRVAADWLSAARRQ